MANSESRRRAASFRHKEIERKIPCFAEKQDSPCFIADVMLGRLAKWLRIAGFDVLYSNTFSDDELVRISNDESRVLLSRDTRLLVRKAVRSFIFLESQELQMQIRQVFKSVHVLSLPVLLTRCISCNEPLQPAERKSVHGIVPEYVFETQKEFKSCPSCGKVFWAGTHRKSVLRTLEQLLQ